MGIRMRRAGFGALLCAAVVMLTAGPAGASHDFGDVTDANPFHDEISWLVDEGITEGFDDGTFHPTNAMTRQAMAAWLYRFVGSPSGPFEYPGYTDVRPSHPYFTEIAWLTDAGIAQGYWNDTFRPGAPVTRQAFAAFVHRMVGEPSVPGGPTGYPDVGDGHPFKGQIAWLSDAEVAFGYEDGTFRPGTTVSRQAAAAWLFRLVSGWQPERSFTVDSFNDSHEPGTLRSAIDAVSEVGVLPEGSPVPRAAIADAVVIELPEGTYTLDQCGALPPPDVADDDNTAGDLDTGTAAAVTIRGLGAGATIEQTCAGERVLDHAGTGLLTLENLTITGGDLHSEPIEQDWAGYWQTDPVRGGGVRAGGSAVMEDVHLIDNLAEGTANEDLWDSISGGDALGGGIHVAGDLTITASELRGNAAVGGQFLEYGPYSYPGGGWGGGAAVGGALTAVDLVVEDNEAVGGPSGCTSHPCWFPTGAGPGGGGGIHVDGTGAASISGSTFRANRALGGGARGGGVSAENLSVVASVFRENVADGSMAAGGAIWAQEVEVASSTIDANRARANMMHGWATGAGISTNELDGLVGEGSVAIRTSTISGNVAVGGIESVADPFPPPPGEVQGGGVWAPTITVEDSVVRANQAVGGATLYQRVGRGGGVAGVDVAVGRSTFQGNVARGGDEGDAPHGVQPFSGGTGGALAATGDATVENSTFTANAVPHVPFASPPPEGPTLSGVGSALVVDGMLNVVASTLVGNEGPTAIVGHEVSMVASVIASTTDGVACSATVTSGGHNWVDDESCGVSELTDVVAVGGDPLLGPLTDNGGPTPTMLPVAGSPLLEVVPSAQCAFVVDQRGEPRPQGLACEVGAVEIEHSEPLGVSDLADGHDLGSLRSAIDQANAAGLTAVTIELAPGTYVLDLCAEGSDDDNVAGDLDHTSAGPLYIKGIGAGATIEQSCAGERVFDRLNDGLLMLENVTITGGEATGSPAVGGGVRVAGDLWLKSVTVTGNAAIGDDGLDWTTMEDPGAATTGAAAEGGGLWVAGLVLAADSSITGNTAHGGGGGTWVPVGVQLTGGAARGGGVWVGGSLLGSTTVFQANSAIAGMRSADTEGGGAFVSGDLTLVGGSITANEAHGSDGMAQTLSMPGSAGGHGRGGGAKVWGDVTLTGSALSSNEVTSGGGSGLDSRAWGGGLDSNGDVWLTEVTATGNRAEGLAPRGGVVSADGQVVAIESLFENNDAVAATSASLSPNGGTARGGAIAADTVTVSGSILRANGATGGDGLEPGHGEGGAMWGRIVTLTTSHIDGNTAMGGLPTLGGPPGSGRGGGVVGSEMAEVVRSTFSGNEARGSAASRGGALFGTGVDVLTSTLVANETTGLAGGIDLETTGEGAAITATTWASVRFSTVVDNGSMGDAPEHGSASVLDTPKLDLRAAALGGPGGTSTPLCSSSVILDFGLRTWADDESCGLVDPSNIIDIGGDPLLGLIGDNGGPTPTMMPEVGSPLIDAAAFYGQNQIDQRGVSRPQGDAFDIGAVERE